MSSFASPVPAPLDIFGPSNLLYPLVLPHLPDVLARIVVHYASPLFPRHSQYAGNAVLGCGCHAAFNTRTATLPQLASPQSSPLSLARPFSLSTALTVCGWICRPRPDNASFLLSTHSNAPQAARSSCMFLGYIHDVQTDELRLSVRFADEPLLTAPHSAVHPNAYRGWEHIAVTFQPSVDEEEVELDEEDIEESMSGSRRLYHNGGLAAEDECSAVPLDTDFFILLGRYDTRVTGQSLHGGLCDVRFYSRALDADEVRALYEGEEVNSEQLEVRWRMDTSQLGEDRYVRDSSGHSRHAVVPGEPIEISKTGSPSRDSQAGEQESDTRGESSEHSVM